MPAWNELAKGEGGAAKAAPVIPDVYSREGKLKCADSL